MANLIGIYNENDFYSHHYLTSVFDNDIRGVMQNWQSQETQAKEAEKAQRLLGRSPEPGFRAPHSRLLSYAGTYFKQLNEHNGERDLSQRLKQQRQRWQAILSVLGYELAATVVTLDSGAQLPVLGHYQNNNNQPLLWVIEAHDKFDEDNLDPLVLPLLAQQWPSSSGSP
ncbi:MAG: hypothetical protein ACI8WB_004914 [Phenylobacterium sp.]|jgi:hypothetical protein